MRQTVDQVDHVVQSLHTYMYSLGFFADGCWTICWTVSGGARKWSGNHA